MMSKEQTPVTAVENFIRENFPIELYVKNCYESFFLMNMLEQYAQYREKKAVLEALEREFSEVVIFDSGELTKGTDYFKTEVKPKYE